MAFNDRMLLDVFLTLPMLVLLALAFALSRRRKDALSFMVGAVLLSCGWALALGMVYGDVFVAMRGGCWALFVGLPLLCGALTFVPKLALRWLYPGVGVVAAAVGIDAFFVEPFATVKTTYTITSHKVQEPLRIAVLADIQTDRVGAHERHAVRLAIEAQPDLILLPGDFVQHRDSTVYNTIIDDLQRLFAEEGLKAPLGVYAVRGNVEHDGWTRLYDGLDVAASDATTVHHRPGVSVTALSFLDGFQHQAKVEPQPGFHIAVAHAPDYSLGDIQADLLVAGHTHGGQVQLPIIGPLVTFSDVTRSQAHGLTHLDDTRTLVVSRGVGMERDNAPRLRFLCRPEVVIIDVLPLATR